MQEDNQIKNIDIKKKELLACVGKIVKQERYKQGKGINVFSFEYEIGNGLLSKLEKGKSDTKITTVWKLANAFGYKCSDFIQLIEKELPDAFDFYSE